MEVEVAIRVDVFLSVSLGIGWSCRWEFISLHSQKGLMDPIDFRFGVSQAGESLRFQMINRVLRWKLRWPYVLTYFFQCP